MSVERTGLVRMISQHASTCSRCFRPIHSGTSIEYDREKRTAVHPDCEPAERPEPTGELKVCLDWLRARADPSEFEASLLDSYELKGFLSEKQIQAALRSVYADLYPGPEIVPAGRYALPHPTKEGEFFYMKVWRGTKTNAIKCYLMHGGIGGEEAELPAAKMLKWLVKFGPAKAAEIYGNRTGYCYHCDNRLKAAMSRRLAMGPVCGPKVYGDEWGFRRTLAKMWLLEHEIDPNGDWPVGRELEPMSFDLDGLL